MSEISKQERQDGPLDGFLGNPSKEDQLASPHQDALSRLDRSAAHIDAARQELLEAAKEADHEGITSELHQHILFTMENVRDLAGECVAIGEESE